MDEMASTMGEAQVMKESNLADDRTVAPDAEKRRRFAEKLRALNGKVKLTVDMDALRGRSR